VIGTEIIEEYGKLHKDVDGRLSSWLEVAKRSSWKHSVDVTSQNPNAGPIGKNRVVFDIKGNKYRLIVRINYEIGLVVIRWVGTHSEYNKINAHTI
jgi:mRNA interferase HigB